MIPKLCPQSSESEFGPTHPALAGSPIRESPAHTCGAKQFTWLPHEEVSSSTGPRTVPKGTRPGPTVSLNLPRIPHRIKSTRGKRKFIHTHRPPGANKTGQRKPQRNAKHVLSGLKNSVRVTRLEACCFLVMSVCMHAVGWAKGSWLPLS